MKSRPVSCSADSQYTEQERRNRDAVLAFYEAGVNERNFDKAFQYLGDRYIQHNPNAPDGPEGFRQFFDFISRQYPKFRVEIQRVFVDGDYVAVHVRSFDSPTKNGEAGVDMFRLENGKIVEHWDVIQPIPDEFANPNGMF